MKRPNIKDNNYGHGDHALMWYSDAQDQYIDYLESKLKTDLLNRVSGIDRSELIAAWRDKSGDIFHENRMKTGELKLNDENDCFEVMMRILENYR